MCIEKNNKSVETPLTCDPAQNSAAAQKLSCASSSCLTTEARRSQSLFNSTLRKKKFLFQAQTDISFTIHSYLHMWKLLYVSVWRVIFFYQDRGQLSSDKYRRVGPRDRRVSARRLWRHLPSLIRISCLVWTQRLRYAALMNERKRHEWSNSLH